MYEQPACRGADTEQFYDHYRWADAAKICHDCPIKLQCRLDFAHDPWAFAGGMTPGQRGAWVRRDAERKRLAKAQARREEEARKDPVVESEVEWGDRKARAFEIFDSELVGVQDIADRVGATKSTVQRWLRESGRFRSDEERRHLSRLGGLSGGQKRVAEGNVEMVIKLLRDGQTVKQTATLAGLTLDTVYKIRRKAGMAGPTRAERRASVLVMLQEGMAHEVIAEKVGMTDRQIRRIKREAAL